MYYFHVKVDGSRVYGCPNFCRYMDRNELLLMDGGHNVVKVIAVKDWGTMQVMKDILLKEDGPVGEPPDKKEEPGGPVQ